METPHQVGNAAKVGDLAAGGDQDVDHATGCTDYDLRAALQLRDL